MGDPTLILTDSQGHDLQAVSDVVLDLAYGDDENDFTLIIRDSFDMTRFTRGSRVYLDGTEYGGVVDTVSSSVTTSGSVVQYSGRTWQGLLAYKILSPDTGQDYLTVSGSVSSVLMSLFSRIKLDSVFVADPDTRQISYQFERFTDAWTGLRKMAKASSLKPHMRYTQGQVRVSLLPVKTYEDVVDSDLLDFTATKNYRPVNHLIGLGTGELKNRAVSNWYADSKGTVSETQSLFGLDEVVEIYDYSNAEAEELREETRKKLEELQSEGTIEVTLHDSDVTLDLGDNVAARDNTTGLTVTSEVSKKIIKIEDGVLSVNYEVGDESTSQSLSGSSESSDGGGTAYTAGDGIDITNHVVTAEVTQSELDSVSSDAAAAVRQVSDLAADVGAAQQTADSAVVSASSAQSTADSAVSAASMAQTTAEAAQTAANIAIANAQELVVNGGFEMGDLTGWTARNATGIGVTAVANETHSGNYMLSGNLPTSPNAIEFLSKTFPVVQGRILRCSGWFWNDARPTVANISINFSDGSLSSKTDVNSLGDGWQYFSADVTVPSGVSSGRFRLGYYHPDSNTVFVRADDISVKDITEVKAAQDTAQSALDKAGQASDTATSAKTIAEGASANATNASDTATTAKTAADDANSTAASALATAQTAQTAANLALANAQELVVNGGFETGDLTGWTASGVGVWSGFDQDYPHSGNYQARFAAGASCSQSINGLVSGHIIRCSFWQRGYDGRTATMTISFNGGTEQTVGSITGVTPYTSAFKDFTVPVNTTTATIKLTCDTDYIRFDDISVKDITEAQAAQNAANTAQTTANTALSQAITLQQKLDGIAEGANNYALPAASTSTLGGVKPDGKTITVSSDGTITAQSDGAAVSFIAAWPIGSIYHSTQSTNPGTSYGGTWRSLPSQGGYLWERLT